MPRYVPKTYNNRRGLRIIVGTAITIALSVVILFLMLFFIFQGYVVDGRLEIPWLLEDNGAVTPRPVIEEPPNTLPNELPDDFPDPPQD